MTTGGASPRRRRAPAEATSTVPELDARLGNVPLDVWLVSRATTALINDAVKASGLNADEFAVYSVLASTDGMTPSEARALDGRAGHHRVELRQAVRTPRPRATGARTPETVARTACSSPPTAERPTSPRASSSCPCSRR